MADILLGEEMEFGVYNPLITEGPIYADLDYLNRLFEDRWRLVRVLGDPYDALRSAHAIAVLTE